MTGTERKRRWRLANPERRREAERRRAQARRNGFWEFTLGRVPRACAGSTSYWRYEHSTTRFRQRAFNRLLGPGAHRLPREEFKARNRAVFEQRMAEVEAEIEERLAASDRRLETAIAAMTPEERAQFARDIEKELK